MSECICHYGCDDYSPTVCTTTVRTARKAHLCIECGEDIEPGQRYEDVKGLWDGHWDVYKTCIPCTGIRRDLMTCGYIYGQLREDISEYLGFDYVTGERSGCWLGSHQRRHHDHQ